MRGCLFVLFLAAALLAGVAWFGSGTIAATAIGAALDGTGYRAASTSITATADPPPRLLLGHADRVSITGSDVDWRALHANRLSLTLDDVDLFRRSAGRIRGSIGGARLDDGTGGSVAVASIVVDGPASAAPTTIVVDPAAVRAAIVSTAASRFGISISDALLVAPDRLRLVTPVGTIDGRLSIDADGALVFDTRLGSVPILTIDPSLPLRLRSVAVVDGALRVDGVLDAEALIGG